MERDALTDDDNRLLFAWRAGTLDEQALQRLETRFFFEPALAEAARLDQALSAGLSACHTSLAAQPRARGRHWQPLLAAGLGALAALAAVFGLGTPSPLFLANVEIVAVDVRRGAAEEPFVLAPTASSSLVAVMVPVPAGIDAPVALRFVTDAGARNVLTVPGLLPSDGVVTLAFAKDALAPGVYALQWRGNDQSTWSASDLRVDYQPGG